MRFDPQANRVFTDPSVAGTGPGRRPGRGLAATASVLLGLAACVAFGGWLWMQSAPGPRGARRIRSTPRITFSP